MPAFSSMPNSCAWAVMARAVNPMVENILIMKNKLEIVGYLTSTFTDAFCPFAIINVSTYSPPLAGMVTWFTIFTWVISCSLVPFTIDSISFAPARFAVLKLQVTLATVPAITGLGIL